MSSAPTPTAEPLDLHQLLRTITRRRSLLLLPWGVALAVGTAAAFLLTPIYLSRVTMMVQGAQPLSRTLGEMVGGGMSSEHQAEVMREQMQSTIFLRSAIQQAGARTDAATRSWALEYRKRYPGLSADDAVEAFLTDYLRGAISVRRDRGDVILVTVADRVPSRAQKFANAVAAQFVAGSKAAQLEAVRATQEFSIEQQRLYKQKLEDAQARLDAAQRVALAGNISSSTVGAGNLSTARAQLDQAGVNVEEQRRRITDLRSQIGGRAQPRDESAISSPRARSLEADLIGLERQLAMSQLAGGGDNSGARVSFSRKYAELETELSQAAAVALPSLPADVRDLLVRVRLAHADLSARDAGRAYIAGQVSRYEQQVVSAPSEDNQLARLKSEVENNRALYQSFLQQSAAAQIQEAFENAKVSGRFEILEPATLPMRPAKPNRVIILLLSFVMGGIVGIGSVLVAEHHDQSMRNADEIESLIGLPVLGAVPRVEELERGRRRPRPSVPGMPSAPVVRDSGLLHRLKTETPLGLEFRRIYLRLAKTRGRSLPHTILVTSATRGEGKTTTTACLAITLARELREKVLLVDFDLRSPSLHRALGLPSSSWGLAQMLHNRTFDERHVRSTVMPHLDFLGAGKSDRPASELIDTESAEWFVHEARARYPIVVLDVAPNLAVPDPLMIGRVVDGVIYVIKAGSTVRKAAEYGIKVQREARDNVLGVLVNDIGDVLPAYYGYRNDAYGYTSEVAGGGETS